MDQACEPISACGRVVREKPTDYAGVASRSRFRREASVCRFVAESSTFRRRMLFGVTSTHSSLRMAQEVRAAGPIVLVPFSTRLPPELLDRLRLAAPQLGLRQGEITAAALDLFLIEEGF